MLFVANGLWALFFVSIIIGVWDATNNIYFGVDDGSIKKSIVTFFINDTLVHFFVNDFISPFLAMALSLILFIAVLFLLGKLLLLISKVLNIDTEAINESCIFAIKTVFRNKRLIFIYLLALIPLSLFEISEAVSITIRVLSIALWIVLPFIILNPSYLKDKNARSLLRMPFWPGYQPILIFLILSAILVSVESFSEFYLNNIFISYVIIFFLAEAMGLIQYWSFMSSASFSETFKELPALFTRRVFCGWIILNIYFFLLLGFIFTIIMTMIVFKVKIVPQIEHWNAATNDNIGLPLIFLQDIYYNLSEVYEFVLLPVIIFGMLVYAQFLNKVKRIVIHENNWDQSQIRVKLTIASHFLKERFGIKKTVYLSVCLIFIIGVLFTIAQQYKQFNMELEQLQKLEKTHSDIFSKPWIDEGLTKFDTPLSKVEDVYAALDSVNEAFPEPDNAESFIKKLTEYAEIESVEIVVASNIRKTKDFYTENMMVLRVNGSEESLARFSVYSDSIKQLNRLNESLLYPNTEYLYRLEISVYAQVEDEDQYFVIDRSIVNRSYMASEVWIPYLSDRSQENIKKANRIIDDFKDNRKRVDDYYLYSSSEEKFIDRRYIIEELSKDRQPISSAFKELK